MKIAALISDLSSNCIVRSYPIIRVLQRQHRVDVIGVTRTGAVFGPYRDALPYRTISQGEGAFWPESTVLRMLDHIAADAVYAFKPVTCSFGTALLAKLKHRVPVLLDIEDFDNWLFSIQGRLWKCRALATHWRPASRRLAMYDWCVDQLHGLASAKTVVSRFLQKRYGGTLLPHGPDPGKFDPSLYAGAGMQVRREFGLDDRTVVLFAGTVRGHKGLELLCSSLSRFSDSRCVIAVCGVLTNELSSLLAKYPSIIRHLGPQPHARMPLIWLAADLVAVPQDNSIYASAQVPGKVFEAMAMERPIIASAVSDLPEILDGCGWTVAPNDEEQLVSALRDALAHPDEARERGRLARQRYLERYSWDVMEDILKSVVSQVA